MFKMIKMPYQMIPLMIEAIHYNKKFPQNHNVIIPNKNENVAKVYSNGRWVYRERDEIIFDLVDGKYFLVDNFYNDMIKKDKEFFDKKVKKEEQRRYEEFTKKYDSECEKRMNLTTRFNRTHVRNNGLIYGIKRKCLFMMLGNQDIVEETMNMIKTNMIGANTTKYNNTINEQIKKNKMLKQSGKSVNVQGKSSVHINLDNYK